MTISKEKEMGKAFFKEVKQQLPLISDPVLNQYYNCLGHSLVENAEEVYYPYYFFIIDKPTLNAFSGPGGYVFMYRGLFLTFDTEDELAAVTAHEIGHVVCRHIAKRLARNKKLNLATMVAMLAGTLLAGSPEMASAVATTSMATGMAMALRYSREDEEEADRTGLKILLATGYDGKAMVSAFKKLARFSLGSGGKVPAYLKTHPNIDVRIVYISNTLKRLPTQKTSHDQTMFHLMQARLRALFTDRNSTKVFFTRVLHQNPQDVSAYYGLALCLIQEKNWPEAVRKLQQALKLRPKEPLFERELGICYAELGEFSQAIFHLQKAPPDIEVAFYLGLAYQNMQRINAAIATWQKAVATFQPDLTLNVSDYSRIYYNLGQLYAAKKQMDWAHYCLGMYFELEEKPSQARYHLQKALALTHDDKLIKQIKQVQKK
ncbi:MAG: M48 family metalloprotease [Candidatus Desulfofervidaceae bacterium]|nr:M48 family metalloprotease [Candidatus Desulfofervidaceae bacterium]